MIGKWSSTPLSVFLQRISADTSAKQQCWFRVCGYGYYEGIDMPTALHPRTPMAFKLSDDILPTPYGYPFKIRIPTKLGFKNPKFVTAIYVTNQQPRGFWMDQGATTGSTGFDAWDMRRTARSASWRRRHERGMSKTRLYPPLRPDQAAALSAAFLRDISENIALAARDTPITGYVAYAPEGTEALFDGHLAHGTQAAAGGWLAADAA